MKISTRLGIAVGVAAAVATALASTAPASTALGGGGHTARTAAGHAAAATVAASVTTTHAVPWRRVGTGWTVATWSPKQDAAGTLYLMDPDGHRWPIAAVPADSRPVLWSPDGGRVIVSSDAGLRQITLRTGRSTRLDLPEDADAVTYSHPSGLAVLASVQIRKHSSDGDYLVSRLERFGLDSRHQRNYPRTVEGAGRIDTLVAIENRAGTQVVVGADRGLVLLRNDGHVVRRLVATKRDCEVASWWRPNVALASCSGTLWAVPTSGAKATRVSKGRSTTNPFGYSTAWRYSSGTLGLAPNGCGPQSLVRFTTSGDGTRVTVPQPIADPGRPVYVGHGGDRVFLTVHPGLGCMDGPTTLFAYDAVTHRSTALLGPAVNGGTVSGALAYPGD